MGRGEETYREEWAARPAVEKDVVRAMSRLKGAIQSHKEQVHSRNVLQDASDSGRKNADMQELARLIGTGGGGVADSSILWNSVKKWLALVKY